MTEESTTHDLVELVRGQFEAVQHCMRITFEIYAKDLKQIQKTTGQEKKSPAISHALADFLSMRKRQAFIEKELAGQTDYARTNEELEGLEVEQV